MREELLHFIWRHRHFQQQGLQTEDGRLLQVLFPGEPHNHQGPDFRLARIRIGDIVYEGPVELHVRASDWARHGHDGDIHYREVILHVVWENDLPEDAGEDPWKIPMLVLASRVSRLLLSRYEHLMRRSVFVPCERHIPLVGPDRWEEWIGQLGGQRLQRRLSIVQRWLSTNRQDWEETTWWMMARSMGLPVNAVVFEAVARSLPLRLLHRHRMEAPALEALLLGQAGLLGEEEDREYRFLQAKYELVPVAAPVAHLRMRPGHFPAARLLQLAGLLAAGRGWFAFIRDEESADAVMRALAGPKGLGAEMRRGILINAFIPILFAYGQREKAIRWLRELKPERNHILRHWADRGVRAADAAGSQGLLELKKEYCDTRRCLECSIGRAILSI